MIKQRLAYTDYNGTKREEDFYFHLSKAQVLELNLSKAGGIEGYVQSIVDAQDNERIYYLLKNIILSAYGVKEPDGKRLIKKAPDGHRLADEFEETEAFSELIVSLMQNPSEAAAFIRGILPEEFQKKSDEPKAIEAEENIVSVQ